jgi:peptide/nickel transport system substrate-binding protein
VYKASSMLTGEPELKAGPPQTVTYNIDKKAVWSDGTPISCADYQYTWEQIAKGNDIYDKTGYQDIAKVDCPDGPTGSTAVTTYSKSYAGWKQLFGGQFGILPSHLLKGKDRAKTMANGYAFSGGPWMMDGGAAGWKKGTSIKLVPNAKYWGKKPKLDSVTFLIQADTAAEFESFKAGTVKAVYPQPQLDAVDEIASGIPDTSKSINADATPNLEALWINNSKFPFDNKDVRQAFAYALDRDAIVNALFGKLGVDKALQSFNETILGKDFGDPESFSGYKQDLDKVDSLMKGAGFAKGSDKIWAKGGKKAEIVFKTTAGNARRERTQELIIEQAKDAGFKVTVQNQQAGDLFGDQLPKGDFTMALYAQVLTSLEPSNSSLFVSKNIPTQANGFSGQNWTRTKIADADAPLLGTDSELDQSKRSDDEATADKLLAEDATSIPLDPLPVIFLWSNDIVGPKEGQDNPIFGPFSQMNEWALKA